MNREPASTVVSDSPAQARRGEDSGVPASQMPDASGFYCPDDYRQQESVGFLMKRVVMSILAGTEKRLGPLGLTSAQWGPLMRVDSVKSCTVVELARWFSVDAGAMTRLLDRLERKGLCRRMRCTDDRRVVRIGLTPEGEAAIGDVPTVLCEVLNQHLAGFSHGEWHALEGYLRRMLDNGEALRDPG